jgi:hypothetical protein
MVLLFIVLMALGTPTPTVSAGSTNETVVALHAVPATDDAGACGDLQDLACSGYSVNVSDPFGGAFVYLVVARGDPEIGIAGVSFAYDTSTLVGVDGWTLCADSQTGHQSGTVISWNPDSGCQRNVIGSDGVHAVAGVFHVSAVGYGFMTVHPNQEVNPPRLSVLGCDGSKTVAGGSGLVTFGNVTDNGVNPCISTVPTRNSTWGRLKSLWGSNEMDDP